MPLVRTELLLREPAVTAALARLTGRIPEKEMRAMNRAVDVDHQDVSAVVRELLEERGRSRRVAGL